MSDEKQPRSASTEIIPFSPADPANPKNWSRNAKRLSVMMVCILVFVSVIGSSLYAPAELQIRQIYGVNANVASLGLTLYILGFAFGPLICPMGEMYGRKRPYLIAWPLYIFALAPSAWIDNAATILLFRFLAGALGAAVLNNGQAVNADLYSEVDPQGQAIAANYFMLSAFTGPVLGPVVGFFVSTRVPHELWTLRIQFFLAIAVYPVVILMPETHGPTILAARARRMRQAGHPQAWAHHELHQKTTAQLMRINLIRPMGMLLKEPIVIGATVWTSLSYGIQYFLIETYPVVFVTQHGIPLELAGLPFIPIVIGMMIAVFPYVPLVRVFQTMKMPGWLGDVNDPQLPESRLKLALVACICLPMSCFWLAWTSGPETHWIAPALSGIFFGFANIVIMFTFVTYLANVFTLYTASAGAATLFARSVIGSIFPIVAHNVIDQLGTTWGISLFGFISFGLVPVPLFFLRYGKRLRAGSHYAQEARTLLHMMHSKANEKEDGSLATRAPTIQATLGVAGSAGSVSRLRDGTSPQTSQTHLPNVEAGGNLNFGLKPLEIEPTVL